MSDSNTLTNDLLEGHVIECRICYQTLDANSFCSGQVINPCNCQGMYAFAHKTCLEARLQRTARVMCDICRFAYIMTRKPKPLHSWLMSFACKDYFIEIMIQTFNILIVLIVCHLILTDSRAKLPKLLLSSLMVFQLIHLFLLIIFWIQFVLKSRHDMNEWKISNFFVSVQQNPDYRLDKRYLRPRSPVRASGAFESTSHQKSN
ncbi:E3 ubiquitin-protein ligase MARCHF3-like [Oppia nitens]|uniref:E3 ubiquitin-protein ligase MARCHF3-like n=1 Tax=Oppia nitens TaxID=1686743 RepID=UPI0023DBF319|nr:E3 ubiquitin-protein ligase MARCHF3-like [Oppia nitens]